MKSYKEKFGRKGIRSTTSRTIQKKKNKESGLPLKDNRPEAVVQRKLQEVLTNRSSSQKSFPKTINSEGLSNGKEIIQKKEINDSVIQFEGGGKELLEEAMMEYEEDQEYDDYYEEEDYEEDDQQMLPGPRDITLADFMPPLPQSPGFPITVNQTPLRLTASQIRGGRLEPVPNRTNGDIQLRINTSQGEVILHIHPTAGSGGSPTGGGSSLGGSVGPVPGNVPQNIVNMIANRSDYNDVVARAAPRSRAAEDSNWRNR